MDILKSIRDWSEVWAFLIPLTVILSKRRSLSPDESPIIKYVIIGLVINILSTTMFVYHRSMPVFFKNNNVLYNIHTILRVGLFSWYIINSKILRSNMPAGIILIIYTLFAITHFIFFQSPFFLSTSLFIAETIVLIFLCTSFFYRAIMDDEKNWLTKPSFLVCAGLFIFESVNFFIFLFYTPLGKKINSSFGKFTWTIHNFSLVFFCIVLAVALLKSGRQKLDSQIAY